MKKAIRNLNLGVLLTGLVILSSCGNSVKVSSAIGINVVNRTIPALTIKLTRFSEAKIGEFLKSSSLADKGSGTNVKKVEKPIVNPRVKPISISVHRDARLV
ncbi:MAG: hypothetical protein WCJ95_07500 [Mariniphaga sp.]